jgi:hypothetical protein
MLFHVQWVFTDRSEDGVKRGLQIFQGWQPPAGADFKGFFGSADGTGGVAIVDVDSETTLARTMAPFTPYLEFTADAILPIEEAAAISAEGIAFRDSIS